MRVHAKTQTMRLLSTDLMTAESAALGGGGGLSDEDSCSENLLKYNELCADFDLVGRGFGQFF